jgi:predicted MFS family arabinose efflux permease
MAHPKIDQSQQVEQAVPAKASLVMMILLLVFFLGTSDNQMISPLLLLIANDLGYGDQVGDVGTLIFPAYALAAAAAALVVGPLSDKHGRRRFLLYATILFSLSLLSVFFIKDAYTLAFARLFTGFAAGVFSTCAIAYVADFFPYQRRGVAMSVVQAGYFGALVIGVPLANQLGHALGWRTSFAFFGALSVLAFFLIAMLLPDDARNREPESIDAKAVTHLDNLKIVFGTRERVASVAAAFFVSGGFVGFFSYLGSWLEDSLRLSPSEINLFFVIIGFALVAGAVVAGIVSDKFGKRTLSILATIALAPMLGLIPGLGWGLVLFACFFIASLAFAFRQGPLQALATELVPRRTRGSLIAIRNTASQIGIAMATAVSGSLYDSSGYQAVGLFSGAMTLIAGACIFLMKEPRNDTVEVGEAAR